MEYHPLFEKQETEFSLKYYTDLKKNLVSNENILLNARPLSISFIPLCVALFYLFNGSYLVGTIGVLVTFIIYSFTKIWLDFTIPPKTWFEYKLLFKFNRRFRQRQKDFDNYQEQIFKLFSQKEFSYQYVTHILLTLDQFKKYDITHPSEKAWLKEKTDNIEELLSLLKESFITQKSHDILYLIMGIEKEIDIIQQQKFSEVKLQSFDIEHQNYLKENGLGRLIKNENYLHIL